MTVTLLCTVRGCRAPLERQERQYLCANRHCFDVARSGYVNLLQPQDRRSASPGDSRAAVEARRRFLQSGAEAAIVDAIVASLPLPAGATLLDVGCGEGHYLSAFGAKQAIDAWGLDISTPAIDLAARRDASCGWVIANADRFVPFADRSFDAITSITARMNPDEFHRILRPDGALLVAVAAADDLAELRQAVQGEGVETDRAGRAIDLFSSRFRLVEQKSVRVRATLGSDALADLLASTYRGLRHSERERAAALSSLDVTLSRDILRLAPLSA